LPRMKCHPKRQKKGTLCLKWRVDQHSWPRAKTWEGFFFSSLCSVRRAEESVSFNLQTLNEGIRASAWKFPSRQLSPTARSAGIILGACMPHAGRADQALPKALPFSTLRRLAGRVCQKVVFHATFPLRQLATTLHSTPLHSLSSPPCTPQLRSR